MLKSEPVISDMPWFKFFGAKYSSFVRVASRETAGDVFKAICAYVCGDNSSIPELTDGLSVALFQSIKEDIDESFELYIKRVEAGRSGGRPKKTIPNHIEPLLTEEEGEEEGEGEEDKRESVCAPAAPPTPSEPKKSKPVRHEHGRYGWVKMSDEEYSRLLNELGESELERCIAYVDESAQSTGNKNKWRDWNLVIRRCHRDGWGLGKGAKKSDEPFVYDPGDTSWSL